MQAQQASLQDQIRELKEQRGAIILAHNYQLPEVQDVADYVGDSLGLARQAASSGAPVIAFCGVHFMAETASIISPGKTVLIPDPAAGCSLSDSITADELVSWKARHPGAVAVGYVNTTAQIKAELDYCCTSSNAVDIVRAIPEDKEVLFLPDMFLGSYVAKVTGRKNMRIWAGECHVHAGITPEDINKKLESVRGAEFLIHPECSCTTPMLYDAASGAYGGRQVSVLSTEGMMRRASESESSSFVVATETGILHRMRRQNPDKEFVAASDDAECKYMKMITLEKLRDCLLYGQYEVRVPKETADQARLAIDRMLAVG